MSTKPTDANQKPSEWIQNFADNSGLAEPYSSIAGIVAYLDEQHAAGQGEPLRAGDFAKYKGHVYEVRQAGTDAGREMLFVTAVDDVPDVRSIWLFRHELTRCPATEAVNPVAAPPSPLSDVEETDEPAAKVSEDCADCVVVDGCKRAHELRGDLTAALSQVEALTKERDEYKFDAEYNVSLKELREAKRQYQERDEELQKLDDVVRELGGDHEQGPEAFIRSTQSALAEANARAERPESELAELRQEAFHPFARTASETNEHYGEPLKRALANAQSPKQAGEPVASERGHLIIGDKVHAEWMAPGVTGEVIRVDGSAIPYMVSYLKLLPAETWAMRKDLTLLAPATPEPVTGEKSDV